MGVKDTKDILQKLGIAALNAMQVRAYDAITSDDEVILLSPTGSGKTLAFLLPIIATLDSNLKAVQVMILVPSRELAIQIEQVVREMGSGYKANAVYGGQSGYKDKIELKHPPTLLIGTLGRIADHIRRDRIDTAHIKMLVLDEFDKSLEVGFTEEMKEIIDSLSAVKKKVLTSATQKVEIPPFVGIRSATHLNFLKNYSSQLQLRSVLYLGKDKPETLVRLLKHIGKGNGIIFCNFKESIRTISQTLAEHQIDHGCFYGGLEQVERERALIKFRNVTYNLLVATDLAARGIDVPEMDFLIHYQLPHSEEEFVHRNGRTARMQSEGMAYILCEEKAILPSYIKSMEAITLKAKSEDLSSQWETLFISGGRKDKISKGDIAGMFFKQGKLSKDELGIIELKQDCSFVSVHHSKSEQLIELLNNTRLKKKKVRISLLP
ncbi:MAG: DEAD/DEAH box helicase [Cyclobacteriaceae bacterium]